MKPADAAKKCRIPVKEIEILIDLVCKELAPQPQTLRDVADLGEEKFTTGDSHIDDVLGGGVRTGMLWEISGEKCVFHELCMSFVAYADCRVAMPARLSSLCSSH